MYSTVFARRFGTDSFGSVVIVVSIVCAVVGKIPLPSFPFYSNGNKNNPRVSIRVLFLAW